MEYMLLLICSVVISVFDDLVTVETFEGITVSLLFELSSKTTNESSLEYVLDSCDFTHNLSPLLNELKTSTSSSEGPLATAGG